MERALKGRSNDSHGIILRDRNVAKTQIAQYLFLPPHLPVIRLGRFKQSAILN